jgi:hypothetical protein
MIPDAVATDTADAAYSSGHFLKLSYAYRNKGIPGCNTGSPRHQQTRFTLCRVNLDGCSIRWFSIRF